MISYIEQYTFNVVQEWIAYRRDELTLKEWLKNHKKVRLVARDRASAYASAINEILPECVQVADRFHLLQNLLDKLKEIFKNEIPSEIFIEYGKVLDKKPEKVWVEKKTDKKQLSQLNYDNTPPVNSDGIVTVFDSKRKKLDSEQYKEHAESRKKTKFNLSNIKKMG
ncbi:MAG: transposase [Haloplasmataceae bacterium]|jgi:transposase|nr:transposase [Haloplasmataceae bacterium]